MKTSLRLCAALFCATASATALSGELVESFSIDESFTDSMQYPQGYAEYVEGEFSESKISNKGKHGTYRVSHPVRNYGEGSAIYYIGQPKADHTYDLSYSFYQMWNRTNQATFRIYKLDGTTTEATVNLRGTMIEGDAGKIVTLEIAKGITGVDKVELLNTAPDQTITNGLAEWQNPGWVILDELIVKVYAPDDTSGGGGATPAICPVYDYDVTWNGLVESAQGTKGYAVQTDVIGDLNQDGIEDRIVSDQSKGVRVQFMNADLTFEEGPILATGSYNFVRKAGDFSKDGLPDIIIGRRQTIEMIALHQDGSEKSRAILKHGQNGMEHPAASAANFAYDAVALADADGDGFTDTYVASVPGRRDGSGYYGALLFQVDETGKIPTSPNKLKWLNIYPNQTNSGVTQFATLDVIPNGTNRPALIIGDIRELDAFRHTYGSEYVGQVNFTENLDASGYTPIKIPATALNSYMDTLNGQTKVHFIGDIAYLGDKGILYLTYAGWDGTYSGGFNIVKGSGRYAQESYIVRGTNNMPPLDNGNMHMRATNISVFSNFAGSGKTILNVGGVQGLYTVTLDPSQ